MPPTDLQIPGLEIRETPISEHQAVQVWLESQAEAEGVLIVPGYGGNNLYPSEARALAKLFTKAGIRVHWASDEKQFVEFRSHEWMAPVLVILASTKAGISAATSVILGIISNYLSQIFFGSPPGSTSTRLEIRERNGKNFRSIVYSGPVEGIKALTEAVKALNPEGETRDEEKTESDQGALPPGEPRL